MSWFCFRQLDKKEQRLYQDILAAISAGQRRVSVDPRLPMDDILKVSVAVGMDHPEIFYVRFNSVATEQYGGKRALELTYTLPMGQIRRAAAGLEASVRRWLQGADAVSDKADIDKARWLHNLIVKNVRYHQEGARAEELYPEAYTALGVLDDHLAVCEGIAKAMVLLGERLGLEIGVVSGIGREPGEQTGEHHAWNIVKINGQYAHLDATWDMNLSQTCQHTRYDYFCISDREVGRDHEGWTGPACPEKTGSSYFEKAGCLAADRRELSSILDRQLRERWSALYFKVSDSEPLTQPMIQRIEALVTARVMLRRPLGFRFIRVNNPAQGVFFYKFSG